MFALHRRHFLMLACGGMVSSGDRVNAGEAAALIASRVPVDCVFFGDSITERWLKLRPEFFSPGRVCRGITGQTTTEMLLRFQADVVELSPSIVHIMAGTNDIAGNTGFMKSEETEDNIRTMVCKAVDSKIRVVLASIPPAAHYPWKPLVRPICPTLTINKWLKAYAGEIGAAYADYYAMLDNGHGDMRPGWATGGVHPTAVAYAAMEHVALKALAEAKMQPLPRTRPR